MRQIRQIQSQQEYNMQMAPVQQALNQPTGQSANNGLSLKDLQSDPKRDEFDYGEYLKLKRQKIIAQAQPKTRRNPVKEYDEGLEKLRFRREAQQAQDLSDSDKYLDHALRESRAEPEWERSVETQIQNVRKLQRDRSQKMESQDFRQKMGGQH